MSRVSPNRKYQAVRTEHEKTLMRRQIAALDSQIDRLVYELYGLSPKEVAIVEEAALK